MVGSDLEEGVDITDADAVVAAPVERRVLQPAEVGDPRQHDRHETVHKVPHLLSVQRDPRTLEETLAHLVARVAASDARELCLLSRNQLEEEGRRHRVVKPLAEHCVRGAGHGDLLDSGDLVDVLVLHLGEHVCAHHLFVEHLVPRAHAEPGAAARGLGQMRCAQSGVAPWGCQLFVVRSVLL